VECHAAIQNQAKLLPTALALVEKIEDKTLRQIVAAIATQVKVTTGADAE
jgi:hypothetical protein